jgi:hypothetical protein
VNLLSLLIDDSNRITINSETIETTIVIVIEIEIVTTIEIVITTIITTRIPINSTIIIVIRIL